MSKGVALRSLMTTATAGRAVPQRPSRLVVLKIIQKLALVFAVMDDWEMPESEETELHTGIVD